MFIFDRASDKWVQTARLLPGDGTEDEFHRANGAWTQEAEVISPTAGIGGSFGSWGLSVSGDTIAAGELGNSRNGFTPGVDVFNRMNGIWVLSTTIQLPNDFDFSPASIAIRGETMAVETALDGSIPGGAVYVFELTHGQWVLEAKLMASDPTPNAQFGSNVSLDGNVMVVGAPRASGYSAVSGAAYVFCAARSRLGTAGEADRDGWIIWRHFWGRCCGEREYGGCRCTEPYDGRGATERGGILVPGEG